MDHDDRGRRLVEPKFGRVTNYEHMVIEKSLFERYFRGERYAPRHIGVDKNGKILFDIYHQQISEGNLLPNIDRCWEEIGYFQCGDNPGRKEPGTGEINYRNVFRHLHAKSVETKRNFVIGMEHGNSKPGPEGEQAVIQAYRRSDDF